ncbi:DUF192 domain-containing protein [Solitalea koreensis]|uniref:DUF192 domain-containing protein n=1 Tax=Solitalea koreensis TaxID=543615 RepID=A0A521EF02_9SPHI|nr:DUF192 domain-containing protein [Solitalea koreensis]SMO82465.1 hypothetical protein SAMN06265350_11417 [Solitalea koreensis]
MNDNTKTLSVTKAHMTALMAAITFSIAACNPSSNNSNKATAQDNSTEIAEPKFKKEGELTFISTDGKEIRKINIEIADDEQQREQGLMYRKSMSDTEGMLFKFSKSEPQSFWMHNTYISLDIIYVNENKEIVKIYKEAKPLSDQGLDSEKNAQYVVEVIGGFCDKFGVKEGDKISF